MLHGRRISAAAVLSLAAGVVAGGCSSSAVIDSAVHVDRFEFNQAIVQSWNEQLLLNLVRLRYRDNPLFLDMGSVITSYAFKTSGSVDGGFLWGGANVQNLGLKVGGEYTTAPTLTYTPLQGEAYGTRLLSPIKPGLLLYLSQSGWSLERLLTLCVQKANGVLNAPSASGPTPELAPEYEEFQQLAELLRRLQLRNQIVVTADSGARTIIMYIQDRPDGGADPDAEAVRRILGVDRTAAPYRVTSSLLRNEKDEIALMGRTLISVMYFLANAVEVPAGDLAAGKATLTRTASGEPFDWNSVTGKVFSVRTSPSEPEGAFVSVRYRDHWFFIDDADLNSKSTFNLLTHVFNLKAGETSGLGPVITFPIR
jgi:hypothetical protein